MYRTNIVELENRKVAKTFKMALKTMPQGCRQDAVPWWNDELDDAIYERTRLQQIRDLPFSDIPIEERQLQYRTQASIVHQLILAKRCAMWQSFATDYLKYTAGPKRTAAMIKLLTRESRDCPD